VLTAAGAPVADGRSVGGFLAHHIACAAGGRCHSPERELADAYGPRGAALVRALAPNLAFERGERSLPVDWRRCRRPACAAAPDDPELDAHHTRAGRVTAFTRVIRRGGRTYVQYWLYYPDSTTEPAAAGAWRRLFGDLIAYPGHHRDDWESVQLRLDADGELWVRASRHGGYAPCAPGCDTGWQRPTGWVRVAHGSHAGQVPFRTELERTGAPPHPRWVPLGGPQIRVHRIPLVPGRNTSERSTTGEGIRLVPLETHDTRSYRRLDEGISPPWQKEAFTDPESGAS
jgi:hypothetical protein